MQTNMTPIKSAAGVDEIATRRHKLSTRSRTVLIAIDGQRTVAQLQTMFASFGDIGAVLDELAALGLVDTGVGIRALTPAPPTAAAASPPPSASASDPGNTPSGTGEPPTMQARRLMSDVAVAALGLRAFGFTLKLEQCYSAEELRGLLPTFVQLVTKSKGAPYAAQVQARIEGLIGRH